LTAGCGRWNVESMSNPLPDTKMTVGTKWNYDDGGIHAAYDYPVDIGTPLFAVRGGKILSIRDTIDNMDKDEDGVPNQPANFIMLGITYKSEPVTVLYLHVHPHEAGQVRFQAGDRVTDGQQIGRSGHNGNSKGPHLHLAVMRRHDHTDPFDYLDFLKDDTDPPKDGLAPNGITIFPPDLVYSPGPWARGKVRLASLTPGNRDSRSVRRLQYRLNKIKLVGGANLDVTGNYNKATRAEVQKWQVQKLNADPLKDRGDGVLDKAQAKVLFPSPRYTLVV
jgi:hypothetical protein